jgi:hypothetical protein
MRWQVIPRATMRTRGGDSSAGAIPPAIAAHGSGAVALVVEARNRLRAAAGVSAEAPEGEREHLRTGSEPEPGDS